VRRRWRERRKSGLDESFIIVRESSAHRHLFKPVGDATAIELILKVAITFVVDDCHRHPSNLCGMFTPYAG
jgi:hypothetical protein